MPGKPTIPENPQRGGVHPHVLSLLGRKLAAAPENVWNQAPVQPWARGCEQASQKATPGKCWRGEQVGTLSSVTFSLDVKPKSHLHPQDPLGCDT